MKRKTTTNLCEMTDAAVPTTPTPPRVSANANASPAHQILRDADHERPLQQCNETRIYEEEAARAAIAAGCQLTLSERIDAAIAARSRGQGCPVRSAPTIVRFVESDSDIVLQLCRQNVPKKQHDIIFAPVGGGATTLYDLVLSDYRQRRFETDGRSKVVMMKSYWKKLIQTCTDPCPSLVLPAKDKNLPVREMLLTVTLAAIGANSACRGEGSPPVIEPWIGHRRCQN